MQKSEAVLDAGSETPGCGRKRSPGREHLNRESERPLDPDLVAAFSREQLPGPSAPGGRNSGIAVVSTAESKWPLFRLVLAADRVAASNLGHLGSAQTALPGAASSCPVPPTDQVSRVGSAVPEGQFVVVVGRQVIARATGTSVTRYRRGYTRAVRLLG